MKLNWTLLLSHVLVLFPYEFSKMSYQFFHAERENMLKVIQNYSRWSTIYCTLFSIQSSDRPLAEQYILYMYTLYAFTHLSVVIISDIEAIWKFKFQFNAEELKTYLQNYNKIITKSLVSFLVTTFSGVAFDNPWLHNLDFFG